MRTALLLKSCLLAALPFFLSADGAEPAEVSGNSARKTAPALAQPPVDFNHPPREYETRQVRDWTVLVEKQLVTDTPDLARRALERLDKKIGEALAALPASSHARLKNLTLFLMAGTTSSHGGRDNGLEYFPKSAPAAHSYLDPRMGTSIVIYSAANWVKQSEFWALKALVHEFAHAQHLEQWPENRADIFDAWQRAKQAGLYRNVKDDKGATLAQAYALQNHLEYFAEISCAYFTGCNYEPFNRAGLKAYDPAGFALVEKLWDVRAPPRPNILFLMADDWSWPHAGALGDAVVKTPTFDRVAREGVMFANAHAAAPSCTPSRMAIVTGQWHWRLQEAANLGGSLREGVPVYPELLQGAGYKIGFARKGAEPSEHKFTKRDPFGPRFKSFQEFFSQRKAGEPFCFWHGAGEPHRPYRFGEGVKAVVNPADVKVPPMLPDNETTRTDLCDYYARVQRFDADCARMLALLEKAGELDNTVIVVSGDNGMPFPRCKGTLYDTGTHVPLAIRWGARVKAGRTVTDFVSLIDLAPTFLEAAGLTPPTVMTGRSLMPVLESEKSGQVDATRRFVLTGLERHVFPNPSRAIRTADFLYIRNQDPARWPTGAEGEPPPMLDFAAGEYSKDARHFAFNYDPSPTMQFLLDHRDDPAVKPFFALACDPRPEEELYDSKSDPGELRNVATDPKFARTLAELRTLLESELRHAGKNSAAINSLPAQPKHPNENHPYPGPSR
jgi:arylsulfatase A-like enzyme